MIKLQRMGLIVEVEEEEREQLEAKGWEVLAESKPKGRPRKSEPEAEKAE